MTSLEFTNKDDLVIGIGTGNPRVEKGYHYPNPEIPIPSILGMGILGLGWWVPLVLGILFQVVRKPSILCWIYHSVSERGSSVSCYIVHGNPL